MTYERLAEAIVVLGEQLEPDDPTNAVPRETRLAAVVDGLRRDDPRLMQVVECIQAVMNAYLGTEMEANARALIEAVAKTNKAKHLQLFVIDGPGQGAWECLVRRNRTDPSPAFLKPDAQAVQGLILPPGYKKH